MAETKTGDLFIVDNSDRDLKVLEYLREWIEISSQCDLSIDCFEVRALLALDGDWQEVKRIRKLMGYKVRKHTK